jgi:hypothetical protein
MRHVDLYNTFTGYHRTESEKDPKIDVRIRLLLQGGRLANLRTQGRIYSPKDYFNQQKIPVWQNVRSEYCFGGKIIPAKIACACFSINL